MQQGPGFIFSYLYYGTEQLEDQVHCHIFLFVRFLFIYFFPQFYLSNLWVCSGLAKCSKMVWWRAENSHVFHHKERKEWVMMEKNK